MVDRQSVLMIHPVKQKPQPPKVNRKSRKPLSQILRDLIEDLLAWAFPPRITHFTRHGELIDTWDYQYRIGRKGMEWNPKYDYVTTRDIGRVIEGDRVILIGQVLPRKRRPANESNSIVVPRSMP